MKKAAALGKLYVIVARDSTILKLKKKPPIIPELQRLKIIQAIKYVTYATLGNNDRHYIEKALEIKPDFILLGTNQRISISQLKKDLQTHNASQIEIQRLKEVYDKFELNSSSKIKAKICEQCAIYKENS